MAQGCSSAKELKAVKQVTCHGEVVWGLHGQVFAWSLFWAIGHCKKCRILTPHEETHTQCQASFWSCERILLIIHLAAFALPNRLLGVHSATRNSRWRRLVNGARAWQEINSKLGSEGDMEIHTSADSWCYPHVRLGASEGAPHTLASLVPPSDLKKNILSVSMFGHEISFSPLSIVAIQTLMHEIESISFGTGYRKRLEGCQGGSSGRQNSPPAVDGHQCSGCPSWWHKEVCPP